MKMILIFLLLSLDLHDLDLLEGLDQNDLDENDGLGLSLEEEDGLPFSFLFFLFMSCTFRQVLFFFVFSLFSFCFLRS
jgi:hypothetical protein